MKEYKFKRLNAFAKQGSTGNPAGVIYLLYGDKISPKDMQKIAFELKGCVSEVAYITNKKGLLEFKYYSQKREVLFCGHATIAAMYDLIKHNPDLNRKEIIEISTPKGKTEIINKYRTIFQQDKAKYY